MFGIELTVFCANALRQALFRVHARTSCYVCVREFAFGWRGGQNHSLLHFADFDEVVATVYSSNILA